MEFVKVEMSVPKEAKEVVDALVAVLEHFKAGRGLNEATALLPVVLSALQGSQDVFPALKSSGKDELAAYVVHKVLGALLSEAPEAPKAA